VISYDFQKYGKWDKNAMTSQEEKLILKRVIHKKEPLRI
jgi:hypothetical protein